MAAECPDRRALSDFAAGKLADPLVDRIADHLEKCPDCQTTIVNLSGDQDTTQAALRKVGSASPVDPPVQKALKTAARMTATPPPGKLRESPVSAGGQPVTLTLEQFVQSLH